MSPASATSPSAPAPTRIFRFAVWSAWLSASLSIISGILLFLFYGLEVPRMIAAAHQPGIRLLGATPRERYLQTIPLDEARTT